MSMRTTPAPVLLAAALLAAPLIGPAATARVAVPVTVASFHQVLTDGATLLSLDVTTSPSGATVTGLILLLLAGRTPPTVAVRFDTGPLVGCAVGDGKRDENDDGGDSQDADQNGDDRSRRTLVTCTDLSEPAGYHVLAVKAG